MGFLVFQIWFRVWVDREGIKEREDGERGWGVSDYSREAIIFDISIKKGQLFEGGNWSRDGYYSRKYGNSILFIDLFICLPVLVCFILFCTHRLVCIKTKNQIYNLKHTIIGNDTLHQKGTLLDVSCMIFSH